MTDGKISAQPVPKGAACRRPSRKQRWIDGSEMYKERKKKEKISLPYGTTWMDITACPDRFGKEFPIFGPPPPAFYL